MGKRRKYDHPSAGDWVLPVRRGYRLACCDCGLTHIVNFRVKNRRVEVQFFLDNRATAAKRRERRKRQ